jgi:hypothetical protein
MPRRSTQRNIGLKITLRVIAPLREIQTSPLPKISEKKTGKFVGKKKK